jgi:hypothetical protein
VRSPHVIAALAEIDVFAQIILIQNVIGRIIDTAKGIRRSTVELHLNGFLRTFGAGESAYTFCEPADEVLRAATSRGV